MEKRYSYCRNCTANCGAAFEVADNQVVSHRPDRDNPISRGFMCVKGEMAVGLLKGEEPRLTQSMKRRDDGTFAPIDNDEMIDEIGDRSVHADERAHRGRHLTKGPEEFREVRVDRPKAKPKG